VQDVGLAHTPDPNILAWAAATGRVLITGDVNTMVGFAYQRVRAAEAMSGVLVVRRGASVGDVVEDIHLIAECYEPDDVKDQVVSVPLRPASQA
jgi:hypothetical protein